MERRSKTRDRDMENIPGQNTKTKIKRDIKKCRCCPKHFIYDKGEDSATGGKWYYCRQAVERESSGMRQIEYENYDIPDDCHDTEEAFNAVITQVLLNSW